MQLLPNSRISIADLVGRGIRIARMNWKELVAPFAVASFFYLLSFCVPIWLAYRSPGLSALMPTIVVCLAVMAYARWELGIRAFAMMYLASEQTQTFASALSIASKHRGLILFLISPCLIADGLLLSSWTMLSWFTEIAVKQPKPNQLQLMLDAVLYVLLIVVSLVISWMTLICMALMAIMIRDKATIAGAVRRLFYLLSNELGYIAGVIVLVTVIDFFLSMSTSLVGYLEYFAAGTTGITKEIVSGLFAVVRCLASTPITAVMYAASAICCAGLIEQLSIRLECTDLSDRLISLGEQPVAE